MYVYKYFPSLILVVFIFLSANNVHSAKKPKKPHLEVTDCLKNRLNEQLGKGRKGKIVSINRVRHGYFDCDSCGGKDMSLKIDHEGKQTCSGCGNPWTYDESFRELKRGATEYDKDSILTKAEDIKRAHSGKKITCSHCGTTGFKTDVSCLSCGAPLHIPVRASQPSPPSTVPRVNLEKDSLSKKKSPLKTALNVAGVTVVGGAVVGATVWAFQSQELEGKVSSLDYEHTYYLDRYSVTTKRDWEDQIRKSSPRMPVNGKGESAGMFNIRNCREEIYDYEKYVCGTETYTVQVPYKDYEYEEQTIDNGNGTYTDVTVRVEVTRYRTEVQTRDKICERPIYKNKCDYDTYEWKFIDANSLKKSVSLNNPPKKLDWPERPDQGEYDRIRSSSKYNVSVSYEYKGKSKTHTFSEDSEKSFLYWAVKPYEDVILTRLNMGTISKVQKKSEVESLKNNNK